MYRHEQLLNGFVDALTPALTNTVSRNSMSLFQKIPIDIINNDDELLIYAEIPGVEKENIELDFFNNKLTIIVEKEKNYDTDSIEISEIKSGTLKRVINLPICVTKKDTVSTNCLNGVLEIKIDKISEECNKFKIKPN